MPEYKIKIEYVILGALSIGYSLLLVAYWFFTGDPFATTRGVDFVVYFTAGMAWLHFSTHEKYVIAEEE
jgi:hypothetical protein